MSLNTLPKIGITMGDPAGIGPELCVRLLTRSAATDLCQPIIFGNAQVLDQVANKIGLSIASFDAQIVDVAWSRSPWSSSQRSTWVPGRVSPVCGQASFDYIEAAIVASKRNEVDAIVTNAINKEAWHAAGIEFPGHTELFANRFETDRFCMLMYAPSFSVSMVTTHIGYDKVPASLSIDRIVEVMELSAAAINRVENRPARLVCLGLNPHAGENGLFGNREEETLILPAIELFRSGEFAAAASIEGPLPPDTAFLPWRRESTDCFICMYHDQALIPFKALNFDSGVNVTLGLPMVRTSVDHGTAFDIAWQGTADVSSLIAAVELAVLLV